MTGDSISSLVPQAIIRIAGEAGVDPAPLLRAAGLEGDRPPANDAHLDIERYYQLWDSIMNALGDPGFPVVAGSSFRIEDNELFGFLAMSCQSLGEAFARTARYRVLYNRGARWELQQEAEATRLIWYPWVADRQRAGVRAAVEFALVDMCSAARQLARTELRPLQVHIAHGPPVRTGALRAFFGVEPSFNAPLDELVFPPDVLATPVATFNSRLRDYFDQQCRELAAQLAPDAAVAARVRRDLINAMDGGDPSMPAVSRRLGMSARTLHRRLAEEGARFEDLLDGIREEFAKRYLARGTVAASEVAYLVGFQSPTAFFRAFKRWTGGTPLAFAPQRDAGRGGTTPPA
jgi:AraC-like DNA-binding protein